MVNYSNTRESGYTLSFPLSLLERALGNCEVRLVRCDDDPYITNGRNLKTESVDFGYQNDSNSEPSSYKKNYRANRIPSVDSPLTSGSSTSISFKNCPYTEFKLILVHDQEVNEGWKKEGNDQVYYANYNRHITVDQKKVEAVPERNSQYKCQLRRIKGKYQCVNCKKLFSKKYNAERHQRQTHSFSTFPSRRIQYTRPSVTRFQTDQVFTEEKEPNPLYGVHKCSHCEKCFELKESLEKHKKNVHSGIRPHTCNTCGKAFPLKHKLQIHLRVHTGERPYKCLHCGKQFKHPSNLIAHKKYVHSGIKPYTCNTCGKAFTLKQQLKAHLTVHSDERPFKCLHCGKQFKAITNLIAHKHIHSGIKPHICNTCGKAFTLKQQLKAHLRVHTGERPYKCLHCDKRFKHTSNLIAHKKGVHSGIKLHK